MSEHVNIVAEVGSVHDGSLGNAHKLIDAVAASGSDVIKFQTHIPAAETIRDAPAPPYFKGEPRFEYFERTGFTREQWKELKAHAESVNLGFLSSPFSVEAVDLLEEIGADSYKIGSGEVTNLPMLDAVGRTGKRCLLSSGMSTWAELDAAVETLTRHHRNVVVLQCTSKYPTPDEDVGLNVLTEMRRRYDLEVGLSDHTLDIFAPIAAVALGATLVEKHFTFSRLMYGSDARHSLEPAELAQMVRGIRAVQRMATPVDKDAMAESLREMKRIFEKSIVAAVDIPEGASIEEGMLAMKKPGTGIPAKDLPSIIGKRTRRRIAADTLLKREDLDA